MPLYEFRCPECETIFPEMIPMSEVADVEFTCPYDNSDLRRLYSFSAFKRDMPGHFNNSAGKYVSNMAHLKDEFKRMGDAYSTRTGLDSDFQVIDSEEVAGLTLEGLDSTFKAHNMRNTAALERRIDNSEPPRAVKKPKRFTGGFTDYTNPR